ncbi:aminopeptidase P family protein [bacterium]|nr:aminopeptidase P family protein [bacterium]
MKNRIQVLQRRFKSLGIANFLISRLSNIRWLCGYTGSNGILLVTGRDAYFITDGRYKNQAHEQVKNAHVFIYEPYKSMAESFIRELKINKEINFRGRVGIEALWMNVNFAEHFKSVFPKSDLISTENVVEDLMMVKEKSEITSIRKAVEISDRVLAEVLPMVKPGITENDLSAEITYLHKKYGAQKDAFETIVASGHRSALPHGIASGKKIEKGDIITFDMGCFVDGYPSDMTRTVVLGKATAKQREIYAIVKESQAKAVEAIKPGRKCYEIDSLARKIISDAGYGDKFTHGLGHGLGVEVHSKPALSGLSKTTLKSGMVVTVEPGIYIEGWGGVRIEDDVIVTEDGCEVMNKSPKELIEL